MLSGRIGSKAIMLLVFNRNYLNAILATERGLP